MYKSLDPSKKREVIQTTLEIRMVQLNVTTRSSRVFLGAVLCFVALQLPVHQFRHVIDSITLRGKKSTTGQHPETSRDA